MKYNVIQLRDGDWAVSAGRGRFFTTTRTADFVQAREQATLMSAEWYLDQAAQLIARLDDLENLKDVGRRSDGITQEVITRLEKEDPDFNPDDERGFLC